ncbi:cytochrome c [Parasphingorhabdus marina DSM 22363]|uniref:Cytochrome c n=1 Tax=Parasphingorhabdus marina DSM 22363 TaxID=1123272 RepID=A0A1N6CY37_9SPHN|nr:c-type cytochrome [Parasphingorhabdus marina]SIN63334.1 cytochrome c [Parasphingorhabdus marina DSM 22363]
MKISTHVMAVGLAFALASCGSDPAPGPVEQIVVREPGEAAQPVAAATDEEAGTETDLVATGETVFATCSGCHAVEPDAAAMAGPNLAGIVGAKAGAVEGFPYSEALLASRLTWTEAELDAYLADPTGKVPGTTMVAGALPDPDRRKAVIAWLATTGSD